jgi:hypothetical protein
MPSTRNSSLPEPAVTGGSAFGFSFRPPVSAQRAPPRAPALRLAAALASGVTTWMSVGVQRKATAQSGRAARRPAMQQSAARAS